MAKLLIEFRLDEVPDSIGFHEVQHLVSQLEYGNQDYDEFKATVTDDQGQIIRESE